MLITTAEVIPVELKLVQPARMAGLPDIEGVTAVFVRLETQDGRSAWGCAIAHPDLTGETSADLIQTCQDMADMVPDLHPTHIEFSLSQLSPVAGESSSALCAFDLAFHDLLGLATGMPLYRLMGGYRNRIQTSATVPLTPLKESVELALARASVGFQMLKIKGGLDPEEDVQRVRSIRRALPDVVLRLDADGGYNVKEALDVARALGGRLEFMEQPTPPEDLEGLREVTANSPVPIMADQSVRGPASALELASRRGADGMSVKMATCGGLRCARQIDSIAQAAQMTTMVSCLVEPSLLISAGLSFALGSPNVQYGDLDGNLDLVEDPTVPGFRLEDGWLVARDVPGLGCTVDLS
jgi:L-alanine-DL-glutamate epimerase-like enolase superfamily enzyme